MLTEPEPIKLDPQRSARFSGLSFSLLVHISPARCRTREIERILHLIRLRPSKVGCREVLLRLHVDFVGQRDPVKGINFGIETSGKAAYAVDLLDAIFRNARERQRIGNEFQTLCSVVVNGLVWSPIRGRLDGVTPAEDTAWCELGVVRSRKDARAESYQVGNTDKDTFGLYAPRIGHLDVVAYDEEEGYVRRGKVREG